MEVLEISLERQQKYDKDVHYFQYYLIYIFGKENAEDFYTSAAIRGFADNSEEDENTLTSHGRQYPSEDDRFATCSLLMISIFWETVKKNCNNPIEGWRKQLLITGWNSV